MKLPIKSFTRLIGVCLITFFALIKANAASLLIGTDDRFTGLTDIRDYSSGLSSLLNETFMDFSNDNLIIAAENDINIRHEKLTAKLDAAFFHNDKTLIRKDIIFAPDTDIFNNKLINRVVVDHIGDPGFHSSKKGLDLNTFGNKIRFTIGNLSSFSGIGVDASPVGSSNASNNGFGIFGGINHGGADKHVDVSIRAPSPLESLHGEDYQHDLDGNPFAHGNHLLHDGGPIVGNVFKIEGMGIEPAAADGRIRTDPFVLKMSYDQAAYDATMSLPELVEFRNGCLHIAWLDKNYDGDPSNASSGDRWKNAIQGNFANIPEGGHGDDHHDVTSTGLEMTFDDYLEGTITSASSVEDIRAFYAYLRGGAALSAPTAEELEHGERKESGTFRVGDFGINEPENILWAAIDHNSEFAVVPEPSTYAIFLSFLSVLLVLRRK